MRTFFRLFGLAILVAFVHVVGQYVHVYEHIPQFDVPMHILGGAAMAVLAAEAMNVKAFMKGATVNSIPVVVRVMAIIGFAAVIGILWEVHELLLDLFCPWWVSHFGLAQPSNADTMKDLIDDILGASLVTFAYEFVRQGKE